MQTYFHMINLSILMVIKSLWKAQCCDGHEKAIPFGTAFCMKGIKKLDQMDNAIELSERHFTSKKENKGLIPSTL